MIILAHNRYRSASPSGENVVQEREQALLAAAGHRVHPWLLESDTLAAAGRLAQLGVAWRLAGSGARRRTFARELKARRRDGATVVHLHNPWPLFTYDLALAARDAGLPLIQTLHNSRLVSTNDRLVDAGRLRAPRDAAERLHLQRLANNHGRLANPFYNRALRAWWGRGVPQGAVATYICLTQFQRRLVVAAGLPVERTVVVPNFLDHRGPVGEGPGDYALFVGRLDHTKGIDRLMRWWPADGPPLRVVGDGPLAHLVAGHPRVTALGRQPFPEVQRLMAGARFLVMSSTCLEGFPLVLVEALAAGTPCLVPDLGGLPEIIRDGHTGAVFPPDDPAAAAAAATRLWDLAPALRATCRATYEAHYTPTRHLEHLLAIYAAVEAGRAPAPDSGAGSAAPVAAGVGP